MRIPKTIAILVGLALGWWAAGFVQTAISTAQDHPAEEVHGTAPQEVGDTHAADASHADGSAEHAPADGADHGADAGHADGHGGGHAGNPNIEALVPTEQPGYFSTMTTLVIVLFVLAALVGSAALVMKGPEPPDPADEHHH